MEGGFFREDEPEPAPPPAPVTAPPTRRPPVVRPNDDDFDYEAEAAQREAETGIAAPACPPRPDGYSVCIECAEAAGQRKFYEAFGLSVCFDCQRNDRAKYGVIPKTKAKDEYLLTDGQLTRGRGGLGCLVQPNPHDARYGEMRLYLRSQVEKLALQVWGSSEGLFLEKERRTAARMQRAANKKRQKAGDDMPGFRQHHTALTGGGKARASGGSARSKAGAASEPELVAPRHEHSFPPGAERFDAASNTWSRRCECGFEESWEEL